jgi:hypothetical protein
LNDPQPVKKRTWRAPKLTTVTAVIAPALLLACSGVNTMDCGVCGGIPGCCARNHGQCKQQCGC